MVGRDQGGVSGACDVSGDLLILTLFAEGQQPRTASELLLPATHSIDRRHLTRVCTLSRGEWGAVMQEDKPYSFTPQDTSLVGAAPLLPPY
jgi:hypothetical protein